MINEERVRHMTQMAMYEEKENHKVQMVLQYNKKDYVNMRLAWYLVIGTILYWMLFLFVVISILSFTGANLHILLLLLGLIAGGMLYVVYLYYYGKKIKKDAKLAYQKFQEQAKRLKRDYEILEELYQKEEELLEPEGWE